MSKTLIRELAWSLTAASTTVVTIGVGSVHFLNAGQISTQICFQILIAFLLLYGNFVYQISRVGALRRESDHAPVRREELERVFDNETPHRLAILIPSYREEPSVLSATLLSAALAEYPGRRIVVLVDDPPDDDVARQATWGAIQEVTQMLSPPATKMRTEFAGWRKRCESGVFEIEREAERLSRLYTEAADWLDRCASKYEIEAGQGFFHVTRFFIENILRKPARGHRARAEKMRTHALNAVMISREYARLAGLFCMEIEGFERKAFVNLSHAPNKAMNLNAYIGLLGRAFKIESFGSRRKLTDAAIDQADLIIPDADFLLTLDADSLILSDYALRLMHVMANNKRIAVAQTPYSAFPNAPTDLEHAASATTDIQYIMHQGTTGFRATYWVGANALLRVAALREIRAESVERGYVVLVYIQERTVIEDTGSTVDLIRKGWTLHNYPERLAYSATPADYGSLIIQRRRWSNGGLIILADLLRYCTARGKFRASVIEAFLRIHYLVSPTVGNISMLVLLLYPFDLAFTLLWLPMLSAPYYALYGRDLMRVGYRWSDLARVYALNLLLLPVCLAGVALSIRQLWTGEKASFGRTPKIESRTAIPPVYFGFNMLMFVLMLTSIGYAAWTRNWPRTVFPCFNALFYAYGLTRMVGLKEGGNDFMLALRRRPTRRLARYLTFPQPSQFLAAPQDTEVES